MSTMNSQTLLGLCCGSLIQADFRGLAEAASGAGFTSISLWPTLFQGALEAGLSEADMRAILVDNGLRVTELDPFSSWLPVDMEPNDMAAAFHAFGEDDFYRIADTLGARTLNIIQQGKTRASDTERRDLIHDLCDRAAGHGLLVSVEFLPWSTIGSLQQALDLVKAVDHPNIGLNIDTWHHFRSGGTVEQLATLDASRVAAIQFNDVEAEAWDNPLEETAMGRLPPGEGASDSVAVYRALHEAGVSAPLNVEVFSAELMTLPAPEAARRLADSMRSVIQRAA
jgi:sugar phosphate isomerase/epimerase